MSNAPGVPPADTSDDHAPSHPHPLQYAPGAAPRLARLLSPLADHSDGLLKFLALLLTVPVVLIFFMKFAADVSIQSVTGERPMLDSYESYWWHTWGIDPVFRPRFAGRYLVYGVAKGIEALIGVRQDTRLHPIRLAAALVSIVSIWAGAAPVLLDRTRRWHWPTFYAGYGLLAALSFYVYMPYDLTSLAFISVAFVLLLQKRRVAPLVLLLVCGLFRESNLHIAWFAMATLFVRELSVGVAWAGAYLAAFFAEWWVLHRLVWPDARPTQTPLEALRNNLTSLTAWAVVAMIACMAAVALVVVARRVRRHVTGSRPPPVEAFFLIQIAMVPAWLLFYAWNGANWSEFRVQLPTVLPLAYAIAWRGTTRTEPSSGAT